MINLKLRTEFYFNFSNRAFGQIAKVIDAVKEAGSTSAGICDSTTFGHIKWHTECKKAGIKPLLGAEVVVEEKRIGLLAMNNAGLAELYGLTSAPELTLANIRSSSQDVLKFIGSCVDKAEVKKWKNAYADISPANHQLNELKMKLGLPTVVCSDNFYPKRGDRPAFELFGGALRAGANSPQHILSEREARVLFPYAKESAFTISDEIAAACDVTLPKAENVTFKGDLEKLCRKGIKDRKVKWNDEYEERLQHEIKMIASKEFNDYFLFISDMIRFAKKSMLVGPARGSSAGSLVCYLTFITDINPMEHGLFFERFIDITRNDLPDIDIDFPDDKREKVVAYLQRKYGNDNVAHIGTVLTYQPKSILNFVGKKLDIPRWEFSKLLDSMIQRSSGDSRAASCLIDTLEEMDAGKEILEKYPAIRLSAEFEGHASTSGTHAAGIIVCNDAVKNYCTVNPESMTAQIDKKDAEKINLLKVDILGLRTLSVIEDCLGQIGKPPSFMVEIPLDNQSAFDMINSGNWAGIFQFEGDAVQMLTKLVTVSKFEDIVALSALARPGPLNSGGATSWANRRMGREPTVYLHPLAKQYTEETNGIIVYQEQVMIIGRKIGNLSWQDTQALRRAMAKSMGEEFFNQYFDKFKAGALENGVNEKQARHLWDNMNTMGSWAFNKSHAVSYGLISYWCAYLKSNYPLEFSAATLRHTKGEEQTIAILRELAMEGITYLPFDRFTSDVTWSVVDGKLLGGFTNLKGIGDTTAKKLIEARGSWTAAQLKKMDEAELLYQDVFPAKSRYGKMYIDPKQCGYRIGKIYTAKEIDDGKAEKNLPDTFFFIGILADKVPRDLNEYVFQVKRQQEGRPKLLNGQTKYLNLVMEDDTGRIYATINFKDYEEVGKSIVNNGVVRKSWYLMQGRINKIGRVNIGWSKEITNETHA